MHKICHFSSIHPARDPRIYEKECTALAKAGYEVHLVVNNHNNYEFTESGVHLHGLNLPQQRLQRLYKGHRILYRKLIEINADLYHFHDPELLFLGLKLKRRGKAVVYDAHEDLPRQMLTKAWLPKLLRRPLAQLVERIENFFAARMSAIVTPTPHLKQRFVKINSRSVQVANFTQTDHFQKNIRPFAERPKKLIYVGTLLKVRGIAEMIRAAAAAGYPLHLAGNWHSEEYKNYCESLPEWQNVHFHGYIGPEKKQALFNDSRLGLVLLHPIENYLMAWPVKLFEYMAAGLPVLASNFPLWRQIVEEHQCGLCINPLDLKQITRSICLLMEEEKKSEIMGKRGRSAVFSSYNWRSQEINLLKLYDEILG